MTQESRVIRSKFLLSMFKGLEDPAMILFFDKNDQNQKESRKKDWWFYAYNKEILTMMHTRSV